MIKVTHYDHRVGYYMAHDTVSGQEYHIDADVVAEEIKKIAQEYAEEAGHKKPTEGDEDKAWMLVSDGGFTEDMEGVVKS